jgi:SAM-dependent methyltransferase
MDIEPRIDPLAQAFSAVADGYELGRPPYPPEPIDWAWQRLGLGDAATVIDLAAGTGKVSRMLAPRAARLIAVEPLPEMRRVLTAQVPQAEQVDGTAERIPLPDATANAVFVGEAFHWFDGDRALPEIHRVLRSGGGLVMLFGDGDWDDLPWNAELRARLDQVSRPGVRPENRPWTGLWQKAFERSPLFDPLERAEFPFVRRFTVDGFVRLVTTWSFVAALGDDERDPLLADVARMIRSHGVEQFDVPSRVDAHLTRSRAQD